MERNFNLKEMPYLLKTLDDGKIASIDQRSTVRIFDPKTLKVVDGFKSKIIHQEKLFNSVDISKKGDMTLIGLPKKEKAALFINSEKKLKAQIGFHRGEVESVALSDDEHLCATGGTDGRTFIYHANTATVMLTMPTHIDYVTAIAFSPKNTLVATGSFDKTIHVKNISLMSDAFNLIAHTAVIKKLAFLSSDTLVSVDKEGHVLIWDLSKKRLKKRLPKMLEEILDIALSKDKKFLFVSTVFGNIGVYDIEGLERISSTFLKLGQPVNALAVSDEEKKLFYATADGYVHTHSLLDGEETLIDSFSKNHFKEAYLAVEKNPLLKFSEHFARLEALWNERLEQAKMDLTHNNQEGAKMRLEPFAEVPHKRTIIKHLLKDFVEFGKFTQYIKEKKFALAYSLAAKYPSYKETSEYQKLEEIWEKQFAKAKKAILQSAGEEKAREYLALFRGVSHKARLITELFNQRKAYMLFRKKLAQKDFVAVFALAQAHPFIKELKEYRDLLKWADSIYIKINHHYHRHEFLDAIKLAHAIKDFPDFKEEVASFIEHSEVYLEFEQLIKAKDYNKMYALLDRYPFLSDLPILNTIDEHWREIEHSLEEPIQRGDIHTIIALVKDYWKITYKRRHIIMFLVSAYLKQIERAIEKGIDKERIIEAMKRLYALVGENELLEIMANDYSFKVDTVIDFQNVIPGTAELRPLEEYPEDIFAP